MAPHRGPVLVDTNAILECWRIGAWRALAGGYRVETVEDCVTETQTGFQRRRAEQQIDGAQLRASLAAAHPVGDHDLPALAVRAPDITPDVGECSLWARICSNDPVCADHEPDERSGDRATHGAACHGCLLIAETSCELRNLFLDRSLLVPTMADGQKTGIRDQGSE